MNLRSEELLSAVAERLLKALRQVLPRTVRQFFALAGQHMRWELNDMARRLEMMATAELPDSLAWEPKSEAGALEDGPDIRRFLEAIEALPDDEREAFDLVRVQGLTQAEAAGVAGCVERTIQRRLNRSLVLLTARLADIRPSPRPTDESAS